MKRAAELTRCLHRRPLLRLLPPQGGPRTTAAARVGKEPPRSKELRPALSSGLRAPSPSPLDGGVLSRGRARAPARGPAAAQSPASLVTMVSRPSVSGDRKGKEGKRKKKGSPGLARDHGTGGAPARAAGGGGATGSGRERSQMALGFERKNRPPTIWFLRSPRSAVGSQRTAAIHAGGGGSRGWADSAAQRAEWCSGLAGRAS